MKILTGFLALAMVIALSAPAMASEVSVQFLERATSNEYGTQVNPVQMCAGPLTVKDAAIKVTNVGPNTDTYAFYLQDMPAGWTGEIQSDVMLASGESKVLDLFVLNTYYTEPGTYFFTIRAISGTDGSYVIPLKRIQVNILPCYTLEMSADQPSREVCEETGGDVNYTVTLKNTGKFSETFDLSASPPAAKFQQGSVRLDPGQSASFIATVSSAGLQGAQGVDVTAKSRVSRASASVKLGLDIKNCYSSLVSVQPESASGCIGKQTSFVMTVSNNGSREDNYVLSLPAWVTADSSGFTLPPGASKAVKLTAAPADAGRLSLDVSITSNDRPATKTVSARLDVSECRDIVVIASPASSTVCRGGMATYDVTVKNRGLLEDTITISASAGSLNLNKVTLAAGQSQTVQLNVDTFSMGSGKNAVEITASDGKVSDKSSVDVNVDDCYSSAIEITPSNKTICPFTNFNYTIKLTNTGRQDDTFTVKFKDITENASLATGQSASWEIPAYSEESGVYSLTASAESSHGRSNASAVLVVQPLGKCYAVEVKATEQAARAKVNEARTTNITVRNTGSVTDEYAISVEGPSWAYASPDRVSLEPGVQADVYLYISPPVEADNRSVDIVVNARSNHAVGSATVIALVGNATLPGGGGISLDNMTGAIIFEDGDMPFWKVAAIALIALAIIVILIVRFALLVKD